MVSPSLTKTLEKQLPDLIREIAKTYNIPEYYANPDFLQPRLKPWHQFGLLTHTQKVREAYLTELPQILRDWNIYDPIYSQLSKKIGDSKKQLLLDTSIFFHDFGKILVSQSNVTDRDHETHSAYLLDHFLKKRLTYLDLSKEQWAYLCRIVATHGVIGKEIRDVLKHKGKLNLDSLSEEYACNLCKNISNEYPDVKFEIGIYFLCDSLGKTDIRSDDETAIRSILSQKKLPPELKNAVLQLPLNLKLSENYLKNLFK
jgi:hypothetical protein